MVHSGGTGLAFGIATVLAATQLRDRTSFVESFAAPLRGLVPRAPEHGVPRGRSSSTSSGSEAILAAGIFIAAASRHPRIRGTARHAEDGGDARSKDKSHRKNTEKALTDEAVEDMDRQMVDCAEAGDYEGAAAFRDKLCSAQLDDEASVLQANVEFYAAFSQRDFERIKACWLPSAAVQCVHPYDKTGFLMNGLSEISESFKRVFEESKTKNRLVPEEVKVNLRGATAVVTCQEKIVNNKKVQSTLLATHVFRRGPRGKWLLLHRHASKPPGEWSMINGDENGVAWNVRLQQLMRAAQTLGPGNAQLIVNTANPFDQDDEGDGPFGLTGVVTAHDADSDSSDSDDDEPGELYVEDDDELMMEETRRDVWKALRKLVIEGWITSEDKIEILADMLEHPEVHTPAFVQIAAADSTMAKKTEDSMVEKAHRLLCTNVGDAERRTAWEDFGELIALQVKRLKSKASKE